MLTTTDIARVFNVPVALIAKPRGGVGLVAVGHHPLTRQRWVRVTVDGVDITKRCQAADDREGWAICYRLNAAGRPFVQAQLGPTQARIELAREILVGEVQFWRRYDGFSVRLEGPTPVAIPRRSSKRALTFTARRRP